MTKEEYFEKIELSKNDYDKLFDECDAFRKRMRDVSKALLESKEQFLANTFGVKKGDKIVATVRRNGSLHEIECFFGGFEKELGQYGIYCMHRIVLCHATAKGTMSSKNPEIVDFDMIRDIRKL